MGTCTERGYRDIRGAYQLRPGVGTESCPHLLDEHTDKKVGLFGELHADIPQPQDRKIFLRHIVEEEADKKYYLSER